MTEEELVKLLMENPDKIHKMIWNEAIELAVKECEEWDRGASPKSDIAPEIRKLKK